MKFARIISGYAVDVSDDPSRDFPPDVAVEFVPVPDGVKPGYMAAGDEWVEPARPVYVEPVQPEMDLIAEAARVRAALVEVVRLGESAAVVLAAMDAKG